MVQDLNMSSSPSALSLYQGENWESQTCTSLHNLCQTKHTHCRYWTVYWSCFLSGRPVEERRGNSDVINLGAAGRRSMRALRVPRLVPVCLCPVDGAVLPACAAPASQHADWSVWSCGMSPSAPWSLSPLFLCECQSLAGRRLFKPCQIRRVTTSAAPTTLGLGWKCDENNNHSNCKDTQVFLLQNPVCDCDQILIKNVCIYLFLLQPFPFYLLWPEWYHGAIGSDILHCRPSEQMTFQSQKKK